MGATLEEIYAKALTLPDDARMELVERLLGSMPVKEDLERGQLAEVHRRIQEVESGTVPVISAEDVFRQISDSLVAQAAAKARTPSAVV